MIRNILLFVLTLAPAAVAADTLAITWPGGEGIVYTGTLQAVFHDSPGGRVYFLSDDPPQHTQSDRIFSAGMDAEPWAWAIFTRPGPVLGAGNCVMLQDAEGVILDCAASPL